MNEIKQTKSISASTGTSDLIGMFAFLVVDDVIKQRVHIIGKASDDYFICQAISPLTGEANVAILSNIEALNDWVIIPNRELANEVLADYHKNGWRYGI